MIYYEVINDEQIFVLDAPYRTAINSCILKMQEDGTLRGLKEKWWKEMHGGGACKVCCFCTEEGKKCRGDYRRIALCISRSFF